MFENTKLTTDQFIKDMHAMGGLEMREWAEYLVYDCEKSAKECLETLQRLVDYVQSNK